MLKAVWLEETDDETLGTYTEDVDLFEGSWEFAVAIRVEGGAKLGTFIKPEGAAVLDSNDVVDDSGDEDELVEERILIVRIVDDDSVDDVGAIIGLGSPLGPILKAGKPGNSKMASGPPVIVAGNPQKMSP